MLTYWFPAPVSFWWPLAFTILFAVVAVVAVYTCLTRQTEEHDAGTIASLYGIGLGLVAVSELLMYLDLRFGLSLAAAWSISVGTVTVLVVLAAIFALTFTLGAIALQLAEGRSQRRPHPAH